MIENFGEKVASQVFCEAVRLGMTLGYFTASDLAKWTKMHKGDVMYWLDGSSDVDADTIAMAAKGMRKRAKAIAGMAKIISISDRQK